MNQQHTIPSIDRHGNIIMSLMEKHALLKGNLGETKVLAFFDSGASYSCIRKDVAAKVGMLVPLDEPMEFSTADEGVSVTATHCIQLSFYFFDSERRFTDEFMVLDTLSESLIIGAKTMQAWKIRLDFEKEEILYDRKMHKLRV